MIEQVCIKNYKSIRDAKVRLGNLNVLIGRNGAGKSNFLSFFELVQTVLNGRLGSYVLRRGGMEKFLYNGSKHSDELGGIVDINNKYAFYMNLRPSAKDNLWIDETGCYQNVSADDSKSYSEDWEKTVWDKKVEESAVYDSLIWNNDFVKRLGKTLDVFHFHDTTLTSPLKQMCHIDDCYYLRKDGSNLAAYLYRLQETEPKTFKLLEGTVRSVAPYFKRFVLQPHPISPNSISLKWEEEGSDMLMDAHSLSDGTLRFIALATLLIQEKVPDIVIIDEPEIGLHPKAVNKLAALVRRASVSSQLIVATQSVQFLNNFEVEQILVVDRNDGQTTFERLDKEALASWLDNYSIGEIWEMNLIKG